MRVERISQLGTTLTVASEAQPVILRSVLQLIVTGNVGPSSLIPSTLLREVIRSSETPFHTRATPMKTAFFIVIAVKTSNLTLYFQVCKISDDE
jgi:hypothetical protein